MSTLQIDLKLFGAFRVLGDQLTLAVNTGASIADIGPALMAHIQKSGGPENLIKLIPASRFSTDTDILGDDVPLNDGMKLAILPPVSGG